MEDSMDEQSNTIKQPDTTGGKASLRDLVEMGCDFVVKGEVFANVMGLVHNLIVAAGENPDEEDGKKMLIKFMDELIAGSRPTLPGQKEEETKSETVETSE
jgi:hypothetical protein